MKRRGKMDIQRKQRKNQQKEENMFMTQTNQSKNKIQTKKYQQQKETIIAQQQEQRKDQIKCSVILEKDIGKYNYFKRRQREDFERVKIERLRQNGKTKTN
ncbi:hypothetical protein ACJMK2_006460 [Sinanodonta woodiana]|uniref:Uncharacterized protein n=1 Tax=Sinanodonta woodiana TaxID=1069815 RepID=A0ABD3VTA7_SINWO